MFLKIKFGIYLGAHALTGVGNLTPENVRAYHPPSRPLEPGISIFIDLKKCFQQNKTLIKPLLL